MKVKHLLLIIGVLVLAIALVFAFFYYRGRQETLKVQSVLVREHDSTFSYGPPEDPFAGPVGIAVYSDQAIYVADSGRHRARMFSPDWRLQKNFGQYGRKPGQMSYPVGIAANSKREIFVSEVTNNRIQVFSPEGVYLRKFPADFSELRGPTALAIDNQDRVLVFDRGDHTINVFDREGSLLFKFGGQGSELGQFRFVMGIDVTPSGEIVVSDSGNRRIQVFNDRGYFIGSFSGGGQVEEFGIPRGIAAISDNTYVVADALGRQVLELTREKNKWSVRPLLKGFGLPDGVAYGNGIVYITDRSDNSIVSVSLTKK